VFVFGDFRLDPPNARLRRGSEVIALTPKAFSVLEHLVAHAGRLVTKDEFMDRVWPGVFVGDAALKVCVREIRQALGDEHKTPRYVETVHRRGYRFIAPVTVLTGQAEAAAAAPADAVPQTRYAHSGRVNIAYQVVGDGPLDLILVHGGCKASTRAGRSTS